MAAQWVSRWPDSLGKKTNAAANLALMLVSGLVGLVIVELALRLLHPRYEHLADAALRPDPNLRFIRPPGHRRVVRHPDSGERHALLLNEHGLRQHRSFPIADLESSVNIGFFGDSFTENGLMAAQFSFTEPLDHLLNAHGPPAPINVLNFGAGGFGTSQSLLRYELWGFQDTLDHVFYVYTSNDVGEDGRDRLHRLDRTGRLERVEAQPSVAAALVAGLHLPYLVLDAAARAHWRLAERGWWPKATPPRLLGDLALFRHLLRRFRDVARANGASFHVVWLPTEGYDSPGVAPIVAEEGVATVNLRRCFGERDPAHLRTPFRESPYRFRADMHWNEAGNRLAAACLHRFLEGLLGLPRMSDGAAAKALGRYYAAFAPPGSPAGAGRPAHPAAAAIRAKYLALEAELGRGGSVMEPLAGQLAIRSHFDVYLQQDGWLAYVRPRCQPADFDPLFFLHVVPVDAADLPAHRLAHGFDNLDFGGHPDGTCTVWAKLPRYAVRSIRTGQFLGDGRLGYEVLWEGEIALQDGGLPAAPRRTGGPAAGTAAPPGGAGGRIPPL